MEKEYSNLAAYSKSSGSSPKTKAFLYVVLFIVLIGGAILSGNYFLSTKTKPTPATVAGKPTATPSPTATPVVSASASLTPTGKVTATPTTATKTTPSPTPSTTAKLRIEVLNGSGTQGEASKMASFLKSKGYSITATGNADAFDYTKTVIQLKKSKNQYAAQLKKDLLTAYPVDPTIQTLAESSIADAIVIVGAE